MRFMAPRKHFPDEMGLRLSQLDYDREMAFVALTPEGELAGVSRMVCDPDHRTAEYALLVRSDLAGLGLGTALMTLLVDYARADGLERLEGPVLRENHGMLGLVTRLGFRERRRRGRPGGGAHLARPAAGGRRACGRAGRFLTSRRRARSRGGARGGIRCPSRSRPRSTPSTAASADGWSTSPATTCRCSTRAGILKEHLHTRAAAGLFDVSHMGQIVVRPRSGDGGGRGGGARSGWCRWTSPASRPAGSATRSSPTRRAASSTT